MCIIIQVNKWTDDLKLKLIEQAILNPHGAGIAWPCEKTGLVRFVKSENTKDIMRLVGPELVPFVIHFRLATYEINSKLNHPFSIVPFKPNKTRGLAKVVLFHNGHMPINTSIFKSDSAVFAYIAAKTEPVVLSAFKDHNFLIVKERWNIIRIGSFYKHEYGFSTSIHLLRKE